MENLKKREKEILEFMRHEIDERGYPPTVREICTVLNIKSTSTVHKDLASLQEKGYIKKGTAKPRAIGLLKEKEAPKISNQADHRSTSIVEIPVVGAIAAGTPILAEQNIDENFPVPSNFLKSGAHFMLKVKGESMIEAGIFNGDYILVREQSQANNGDIVVALTEDFENEATVKTFYKEKDHIRLQPENSTMKPIIVTNPQILGLVTGVFRSLV